MSPGASAELHQLGAGVPSPRKFPGATWTKRGWWLVALSVSLNVVEALVVLLTLPHTGAALSLQASAVAPFGVFHDLRWLSVASASWWGFGLELAALVVGRALLTALSVWLAWPAEGARRLPSARSALGRAVVATAIAALLLAPSAVLLFAMAIVPISWLFIAAVPLAVALVVILSPLAIAPGAWRGPIPLRAIGWVLASFAVFSAGSLAVVNAPGWVAIPLSAAAGVVNAVAWRGVVRSLVMRSPSHRVVPVIPVAVAGLAVVVIVGSVAGFLGAPSHDVPSHALANGQSQNRAEPVVLLHGYGSVWNGVQEHQVPGDFDEQRFSYRGLSPDGAPLPYSSGATVKSIPSLVHLLSVQVDHLARSTGRHVDLVGESEGAEVAETYVLTHPNAPVGSVVLLSPLVAPGRVTFPTHGSGQGLAARGAMEVLSSAYGSVSPIDLSPTSAFVESVDKEGPGLERQLAHADPRVREFAILPLADATSSTPGFHIDLPYVVVPGFHGGLLGDSHAEADVAQVLEGRTPTGTAFYDAVDHLVTGASLAWQVPVGNA